MCKMLRWSALPFLFVVLCVNSLAQSNGANSQIYPTIGVRYLSPYQVFGLSAGVTTTYLTSGSVVITMVESSGPAFAAGLRPGDIVTAANGKRVCQADDLRSAVANSWEKELTLNYIRSGAFQTVKVRAVNRPSFDATFLPGLEALPRINAAWDKSDYKRTSEECERLRDPNIALTSVACAQVYFMKFRGLNRGEEAFGRAEALCPDCPEIFASHAVGRKTINRDYLTPWNTVESKMKGFRKSQEQAFALMDSRTAGAMKELAESGKTHEAMERYFLYADEEAGCRDTPPSQALVDLASTLALRENPSLAVPQNAKHRAEKARGLKKVAANQRDMFKAYEEMNAAIWLAPWWSAAYSDAADILEVMGRPTESMELAKRALALPHAKAGAVESATASVAEPEDSNVAPEVALQRCTAALATVESSSAEEQRLRARCIKAALKMNPVPEIPPQASRHLARGQAALEMAQNASDFNDAAAELERAAKLAPWWADAYRELGKAYEKVPNYQQAMSSYQLYLAAAPTAGDTKEIQSRIYKLEYAAEREQKQSVEKAQQQRQQTARIQGLQGLWSEKETGAMWQASIQNGMFVAQKNGAREGDILYRGTFVLKSAFKGDGLEGTMTAPPLSHLPSGCDVSQSEQPATGAISPDGKTITVKYQIPVYSYNWIKATLFTTARCTNINKIRDDLRIIVMEKRD